MALSRTANLCHVRFSGDRSPAQAPEAALTPEADRQRRDAGANAAQAPEAAFAAWVLARAGLDPAEYRREPLARRVPACLRALKAGSMEAARAAIEAQPDLLETAMGALVIGVTAFFRDADAFDTLKRMVIPAWQAQPAPRRVWSAGCSSGAELYSVAMLLAEDGPDPRLVIERQITHLVRLVDDLLDATRISSNKIQLRRERIDLVPLVHHAVESARSEIVRAEQVVEVSLPSVPIWLDADADRLTQLLSNLLNNASRYTPSGGRISISADSDGTAVLLSVSDTGNGLDPADAARVFDMFTQIGGPGTGGLGIGLALVKGIVALHGGAWRREARASAAGPSSWCACPPRRGFRRRQYLPRGPALRARPRGACSSWTTTPIRRR